MAKAKPVKDKPEELKARAVADENQKLTVLGLYDKKMIKAKKARDFAAGEYFQTQFKKLKSSVEGPFKRLQTMVAEAKAKNFETKKDLAPITKETKELSNAVNELDAWTYPMRVDCLELEKYVNTYSNDFLFEKDMTEIAIWDHGKGIVKVEKRK